MVRLIRRWSDIRLGEANSGSVREDVESGMGLTKSPSYAKAILSKSELRSGEKFFQAVSMAILVFMKILCILTIWIMRVDSVMGQVVNV